VCPRYLAPIDVSALKFVVGFNHKPSMFGRYGGCIPFIRRFVCEGACLLGNTQFHTSTPAQTACSFLHTVPFFPHDDRHAVSSSHSTAAKPAGGWMTRLSYPHKP